MRSIIEPLREFIIESLSFSTSSFELSRKDLASASAFERISSFFAFPRDSEPLTISSHFFLASARMSSFWLSASFTSLSMFL